VNIGSNLLDIPALADRLSITTRHVRRLISERRIPFIKVGRLVRFDPTAIEQWLDENRSDRPRLAPVVPSAPRRRPAQAVPPRSEGEQLSLDS
jgi:excisionase family DNA binding protein